MTYYPENKYIAHCERVAVSESVIRLKITEENISRLIWSIILPIRILEMSD